MATLYTIGYGNRSWDAFRKLLLSSGVTSVLDVRRAGTRAWSHYYWPGVLCVAMDGFGISYEHWGVLGNHGNDDLGRYKEWLCAPVAEGEHGPVLTSTWGDEIGTAIGMDIELGKVPCLLCSELDAEHCHRSVIAEYVAETLELEVWHI